jgi:hypothetical protein
LRCECQCILTRLIYCYSNYFCDKITIPNLWTESRYIRNEMRRIQGNLMNLCVSESYLPSWILVNSRNYWELPSSQLLLLLPRLASSLHVSADGMSSWGSSFHTSADECFPSSVWWSCHLRDDWIRAQH